MENLQSLIDQNTTLRADAQRLQAERDGLESIARYSQNRQQRLSMIDWMVGNMIFNLKQQEGNEVILRSLEMIADTAKDGK